MNAEPTEWAERRVVTVVASLVDEAWSVIEPNLADLTDAEYFWEPAPDCWSVRRTDTVRSPDCWGTGDWRVEHCFDGSVTPAMTTIGWRLMHAYDCFSDYSAQAFGAEPVDWNTIEVAGNADEAVALMAEAVADLRKRLANASDNVLVGDVDGQHARWVLLNKSLVEWMSHSAEIGTLRQMYRLQAQLSRR